MRIHRIGSVSYPPPRQPAPPIIFVARPVGLPADLLPAFGGYVVGSLGSIYLMDYFYTRAHRDMFYHTGNIGVYKA